MKDGRCRCRIRAHDSGQTSTDLHGPVAQLQGQTPIGTPFHEPTFVDRDPWMTEQMKHQRIARSCGPGTAVDDDALGIEYGSETFLELRYRPVFLGVAIENLPSSYVLRAWDVPPSAVLVSLPAMLTATQGTDDTSLRGIDRSENVMLANS